MMPTIMSSIPFTRKCIAPVLALFLLGGCETAVDIGTTALFDQLVSEIYTTDPDELHPRVFAQVYYNIQSEALTPPPASQLAQAGLNALAATLPATDPARSKLTCCSPAPGPLAYQAWGERTAEVIETAQAQSAALRHLTPDEIYKIVITAQLKLIDDYSHYLTPAEKAAKQSRDDGYVGIGAMFDSLGNKKPGFIVSEVYAQSPAEKAGLQIGDIVYAVNGQTLTADYPIAQFASLVRGVAGSIVRLGIERSAEVAGNPPSYRDISVERTPVTPSTVTTRFRDGVAILRINSFDRSTPSAFRKAARDVVWRKPTHVVLDLRHNPGGDLDAAAIIASDLSPQKRKSITFARMKGRVASASKSFSTTGNDLLDGLPLTVLMDSKTASAAELLAASLRYTGRAQLAGAPSYGKWSVQHVTSLSNGGELAVTWAHFELANGQSYMQKDMMPDLCLSEHRSPCFRNENIGNSSISTLFRTISMP
jgi:carboxyl-terminal processing protease